MSISKVMCINATQPLEPRVAIIENQHLLALETQENDLNRSCGNIYLGTITSIQSGIDAVFVDFGSQRHGFLPFKEIAPKYFQAEQTETSKVSDLVKVGQRILVQVSREEKPNKGAALTTFLSLAGAYLVIMPNNQKNNGISKKADANERLKLKEVLAQMEIPDSLSIIVRTEGINRSKEELAWDLECLKHHWDKIHDAAHQEKAPALIHQEADTLIRSVRDRLRKNISSIVVDHEPTYEKLKIYLELTRPEFVDKLSLYQNKVPIFTHFGVQNEINNLFMRKVNLPSGGSLVIDHAEAMTVIDVNSSKSTNAKNIEETAFKTNHEAAKEVLKQLVLRDIGGIIVIDFIDMVSAENKQKIEKVVENYINTERAKIRFEAISPLTGCMYLSRQRTGPSILDQHYRECTNCNGLGFQRTILSIANHILYKAEDSSVGTGDSTIVIQTSPDVSCFILNEKRHHIALIEKQFGNTIMIVANNQYIDTKYTIKRLSEKFTQTSYSQREEHEPNMKVLQHTQPSSPAVPQNLYREHPKQSGTAMQRFMNILMPTKSDEPKIYETKQTSRSNENKPRRQQSDQSSRRGHSDGQSSRRGQSDGQSAKRPQRRRSRSANQTRRTQNKQPHGSHPNQSHDAPKQHHGSKQPKQQYSQQPPNIKNSSEHISADRLDD